MRGIKLPTFHGKYDCSDGRDKVVAVLTDDECALDRLRAQNSLPVDRYASVSVILEECNQTTIDQRNPVLRLGTYNKRMHLQPLCSNVSPVTAKPSKLTQGPELRVPPLSYEEIALLNGPLTKEDKIRGSQPARPHNGTIYPWEYANKPPYTSPGYSVPGVKQSVGVVRLPKVPAAPSMGWVGEERMKVPTWVSPLYKPYGVGGPYGPNGPFYRIPSESCQRPVKLSFWKQPVTYIRHALQQKPSCKLNVKRPALKFPAFTKITYLFKKQAPTKSPEKAKEGKPEGETTEEEEKKSPEEVKEGEEHAKDPGENTGDSHAAEEHPKESKEQKPEDAKHSDVKISEEANASEKAPTSENAPTSESTPVTTG